MLNTNRVENPEEIIVNLAVDDEGYLIDPEQWTEAFAASALGLMPRSLCPRHKAVIHYVRKKYIHLGALPPVRTVCKSIGIDKQELKTLFGTCLRLWRAAGLPRPDDEIRAHMN